MANLILTVAQYRAAAKPFPEGTSVSIVDTGSAISQLTSAELAALETDGVTLLDATDDSLSLSTEALQALGLVKLSAGDTVVLRDSADAINLYLSNIDNLSSLAETGIDVIDAASGTGSIVILERWNLQETNLSFDAEDQVTLQFSEKSFNFSAEEVRILSDKGVDVLDVLTGTSPLSGFGVEQAIAFAQSGMTFAADDDKVIVTGTGSGLSQLSAHDLAALSIKGVDKLDATDDELALSLDQYRALGGIALAPEDHVAVVLSPSDVALLDDSLIAEMTAKGVDDRSLRVSSQVLASFSPQAIAALADHGVTVIDVGDDDLVLGLGLYNALGDMKLVAGSISLSVSYFALLDLTDVQIAEARAKGVDRLIFSESGQVLGSLSLDQIATILAKHIDGMDALDDVVSLSLAQYNAWGTAPFSPEDVITVTADGDAALSHGGNHLILTGNAIRGTGNSLDNAITGNAVNNVLYGLGGNDSLYGHDGDDILDGGEGADRMEGGAGNDIYYVDEADDVVVEDVNGGIDLIYTLLTHAAEANIENMIAAGTAEVWLIGNDLNNTIVGNASANNLYGNAGSDTLNGGAGNDVLDGGEGLDWMAGGMGHDLYFVDHAADLVVEAAGEGTDTVYASVSYSLLANVENLCALGSDAITLVGNDLNNILIGNLAVNILRGGAGHDVLDGSLGADRMEGGSGNDTYYVDNKSDKIVETAKGGTDTVYTSVSYTLSAHVERLYAQGSSALNLTGNTLANRIKGNSGANKIVAGSGNDQLWGGAGNDKLYGGKGKDVFVFDTAPSSKSNKDKIMDWNYRNDTIKLENAVFKALKKTGGLNKAYFRLGSKALDKNDFVGYNKTTGDLWYDSNGSKAGGHVVFANIGKHKTIFHTDFVVI